MTKIGFELWTMQKDILFDNIYIGHSTEDAEKLKEETFDIKRGIEEAEQEAQEAKDAKTKKPPVGGTFMEDPVNYVKEKLDLFVTLAKSDPLEAVKFMPEVAGSIGIAVVTLIAVVVGLFGLGSKSPKVQETTQKAKEAAADAKDQAADAVSSGAEKVQAEATKRTTRSSAAVDGSS